MPPFFTFMGLSGGIKIKTATAHVLQLWPSVLEVKGAEQHIGISCWSPVPRSHYSAIPLGYVAARLTRARQKNIKIRKNGLILWDPRCGFLNLQRQRVCNGSSDLVKQQQAFQV